MRKWCLWCGAVLPREADGIACAPCRELKLRQIDALARRVMKAWAPPKSAGNGGTDATR